MCTIIKRLIKAFYSKTRKRIRLNEEKIKAFFKNDFFSEDTGIKIDSITFGNCICSLEIERRHLNAGGEVQGGVLFTLADFAFAVAANSEGQLTVSINNSISFLQPVKGSKLYATTKKLSEAKKICFYEVFIEDEKGKSVAKMSVTGYRKPVQLDFS